MSISKPKNTLTLFLGLLVVIIVQFIQLHRGGGSGDSFKLPSTLSPHVTRLRDQHAASAQSGTKARVAKVSMIYGKPNRLYEEALASHERHSVEHGYPMYILRKEIFKGYWNKVTYLLSILLNELEKEPDARVEWLLWFDADSIILNPHIPLETFLPPTNEVDARARLQKRTNDMDTIEPGPDGELHESKNKLEADNDDHQKHFLVTKDVNGLNIGIFFLRVHEWSVRFLSQTLSYPFFNPNVSLGDTFDQEAMKYLINETSNRRHTTFIPKEWLNSYVDDFDPNLTYGFANTETLEAEKKSSTEFFKDGNMIIHFAGLDDREWWMDLFLSVIKELDLRKRTLKGWDNVVPMLEKTNVVEKVRKFWNRNLPVDAKGKTSCESTADELDARLGIQRPLGNHLSNRDQNRIDQTDHRANSTAITSPISPSPEEKLASYSIHEFRESCWYWSDNTTLQNEFQTKAERAVELAVKRRAD